MATQAAELSFAAFLADVREPGTTLISPARFAQKLDYEQQYLAGLAHVHRNTVSRRPASAQLQQYLREAVRVIAAASDLRGDSNQALFWFRTRPLAEFGYKTPETLVSEGRADDVIRYVELLHAGFTG